MSRGEGGVPITLVLSWTS